MKQPLLLEVEEAGTGDRFRFALALDRVAIGQAAASDLQVERQGVADAHGFMEDEGDVVWYTDAGSGDGTLLNGTRLWAGERIMIQVGDVLTIGPVAISLLPRDGPKPLNPPGARNPFRPSAEAALAAAAVAPDPPAPFGAPSADDEFRALPLLPLPPLPLPLPVPAPAPRPNSALPPAGATPRIFDAATVVPTGTSFDTTAPFGEPGAPHPVVFSSEAPTAPLPAPLGDGAGPLAPGDRFGRYEILAVAGGGRTDATGAALYLAFDPELAGKVTIRTLSPSLIKNAQALARFRQETEAARRIDAHPNVVKVHEAGVLQGVPYAAMEPLDGETLGERIRRGPLPLHEAADVLAPVCAAVWQAHQLGIIHRELNPESIFLAREGERVVPKVLDFGFSRPTDAGLTQDGTVLGTQYLSPEQAIGSKLVGAASDQHSLAAILYTCLVGRPPHEGPTAFAVLQNIIGGRYAPPRSLAPAISADVEQALLRAMNSDAANRFASVRDFGDAFVGYASPAVEEAYRAGGPSDVRGQAGATRLLPDGGELAEVRATARAGLAEAEAPPIEAQARSGWMKRRPSLLAAAGLVVVAGIGVGIAALSTGGAGPTVPSATTAAPAAEQHQAAVKREALPPPPPPRQAEGEPDAQPARTATDPVQPPHEPTGNTPTIGGGEKTPSGPTTIHTPRIRHPKVKPAQPKSPAPPAPDDKPQKTANGSWIFPP